MGNVVLGTGLSHDGSSALMIDGRIRCAIAKERITRLRHDGFNDNSSIAYCLDAAGLSWSDVDLLVENLTFNRHEAKDDKQRGQRTIPDFVPRVAISHHLAHAYSAIGPCPFEDDVAVIVVDGRGSSLDNCRDVTRDSLPRGCRNLSAHEQSNWFENTSVYHFKNNRLRPVLRSFSAFGPQLPGLDPHTRLQHSYGEFYARVAHWVFGSDFHDGKLMGLAPFGESGRFLGQSLNFTDGVISVENQPLLQLRPDLSGGFHRCPEQFQHFADVALWAQRELEGGLEKLFAWAREKTNAKYAAYAGGVALNAVANQRLLERSGFDKIFIQPAAGDDGLAIGCCHYGHVHEQGLPRHGRDILSAFGRDYTQDDIATALGSLDLTQCDFTREGDIAAAAAIRLAQGETVAWFQGGSEFGPRALGQRSILADPRGSKTQFYINKHIKNREDFRPFAPAVLLEECGRYFHGHYASPHMIITMSVRDEWRSRLPAVVHKDGSARVQTVDRAQSPRFARLIECFNHETGVPIVLNTSFNGREMPIIESPSEAIEFFQHSGLHAMALGNFLVRKRTPPARLSD